MDARGITESELAPGARRSAVAIGGATLPAAQSTLSQIVEKRSKAIAE